MEKITKEELAAKLGLDLSVENDLETVGGGEKREASVKKCMEDCMKTVADYDRCRLLCKYGASS